MSIRARHSRGADKRRAIVASCFLLGTGALGAVACSAKVDPPPGSLVVSIDTNLKVPDDIDEVGIAVTRVSDGKVFVDKPVDLKPIANSNVVFPATFTVIHGSDEPVDIRVVGFKNGNALSVRDAVTTIPGDVSDVLQMDINWLDKAQIAPATALDDGGIGGPPTDRGRISTFRSACGASMTSVAGICQGLTVDALHQQVNGNLPLYVASAQPSSDVPTQCFDVDDCFKGFSNPRTDGSSGNQRDVVAAIGSDGTCSFAAPSNMSSLNVGFRLAVGKDGWCDGVGCAMPIAHDALIGWSLSSAGDRIVLPLSICNDLGGKIVSVITTNDCAVKARTQPACQEYPNAATSNPAPLDAGVDATIQNGDDGGPTDDAGDAAVVDAGPDLSRYTYPDGGTTVTPIAGFTADGTGSSAHAYVLLKPASNEPQVQLLDSQLGAPEPKVSLGPFALPASGNVLMAASYPFLAIVGETQTLILDATSPATPSLTFSTYSSSSAACQTLAFSPTTNGTRLVATHCNDSSISWIDLVGGQLEGTVHNEPYTGSTEYTALAYSSNDQMYAVGVTPDTYSYQIRYGAFNETDAGASFATTIATNNGTVEYGDTVTNVAFLGQSTVLYTTSASRQTYLFAIRDDLDSGPPLVYRDAAFATDAAFGAGALATTSTRAFWLSSGSIYSATFVSPGVVQPSVTTPFMADAGITALGATSEDLLWSDGLHLYKQNASGVP